GRHREEARSSWARRPRRVARSRDSCFVLTYAFSRVLGPAGSTATAHLQPTTHDLRVRMPACVIITPGAARVCSGFTRLGFGREIAATRNDPKRGAPLLSAPRASTNRGVIRTDPTGNQRAPTAARRG